MILFLESKYFLYICLSIKYNHHEVQKTQRMWRQA
nr:MAG TPA: hypothetical protein [Crassvirales sp.]